MEKIYGFVRIDIHPGQTDAFLEVAAQCFARAVPDLAGTELYEWFLSPDGRQAWVLEVYDDVEAIAHHGRMLRGKSSELRDHADIAITFAGAVPDTIIERMRERLGAAELFGPRSAGLLDAPTPHRSLPESDGRIMALAWFDPHPGKEADLRALAMTGFEKARSSDPGTMAYEWFFDNKGRALALDVYRDVDAMLAHMTNCGPVMAEILKISTSRTNLFGALPEPMWDRMRPELGITQFPRRLQGIF